MTGRTTRFGPPDDDDVDHFTPIDKSLLSDERKRLFDRVEQINRAWLDSMREMRKVEAEFSIRLFACKGPDDAMAVCNQWMAKRLEILGGEQQLFARLWTDLVSLLGHSSPAFGHRKNAG
jgi:hypothetical protein